MVPVFLHYCIITSELHNFQHQHKSIIYIIINNDISNDDQYHRTGGTALNLLKLVKPHPQIALYMAMDMMYGSGCGLINRH